MQTLKIPDDIKKACKRGMSFFPMFCMDLAGLQPINCFGQGEKKSWEAGRREKLSQSKSTANWEERKAFKIKENSRSIREGLQGFPQLSSLWNSTKTCANLSLPLHGLFAWFSVMQQLSPNGAAPKGAPADWLCGSSRVVGGTAQMWWDAYLGGSGYSDSKAVTFLVKHK